MKKNLLFVEDNPGDAHLIKEAFKRLSLPHAVHVLSDGTAVLPYLTKQGEYSEAPVPDLILLDLNMPKKSGIEVLIEIKESPEWQAIPVVILTSSQSPKDVEACYRHHANCVLTKPFEFKGVLDMVTALNAFWFESAFLPKRKERL